MKRVFLLLFLCVSFAFSEVNFQTATKTQLMMVKGIGEKKADRIIEYRKAHKIKKVEDLQNIKGFGPKLISKIKAHKKDDKN